MVNLPSAITSMPSSGWICKKGTFEPDFDQYNNFVLTPYSNRQWSSACSCCPGGANEASSADQEMLHLNNAGRTLEN